MMETGIERKEHWERVYSTRDALDTSWNQPDPARSLAMIRDSRRHFREPLIDVGGGASVLVDRLLEVGYKDLTVLDIAGSALEQARRRLGEQSSLLTWIEADVTRYRPERRYGLWHDRAVFHFLTEASDRERYLHCLDAALVAGGGLVMATFASTGPRRCSGLDVVRYDAAGLQGELGPGFELQQSIDEKHVTPDGRTQDFTFYRFLKMA